MTDGIYALSTSGGHLGTDSTARLDQLAAQLARGAIEVSDVPMAAPTLLPTADQTIHVEMRGDDCVIEQAQPIFTGTLRLELQNSTGAEAFLGLVDGDFATSAVPDDVWISLGLSAAAGGNNAGVINVTGRSPLTAICEGFQFDRVARSLDITGHA
jgi:hypothetical protein